MRNVKGLTLIELMISLLLGIVIIFLVGTLYLKHKQLYLELNKQVEYNESRRFIHSFLSDQLVRAGFHNDFLMLPNQLFPFEKIGHFSENDVVFLKNALDLSIRYQPMYPNQLSCDGRNIAKNIKSKDDIRNTLIVTTRIYIDQKNNILRCNGHAVLEGVERVHFTLVKSGGFLSSYIKAIDYQVILSSHKNKPIKGTVFLRNTEWLTNR